MTAAIVGAGAAGLLHALSLRAQGVSVAHVFDPDPERSGSLAALCGAHAHDSLEQLAATDAQFASICSPPWLHVAQASRCARRGRIVFIEKPAVVSTDGLQRLARLPGCVPVVQWRMGRAILAVRRAIAESLLGPSPTVSVDLALHRDGAYYARGRGLGRGGAAARCFRSASTRSTPSASRSIGAWFGPRARSGRYAAKTPRRRRVC